MFKVEENKLIYQYDGEKVWIEPWGNNSVRVRATKCREMPEENWALCEKPEGSCDIEIGEQGASLKNGFLTVHISKAGKIVMYHRDNIILEEYTRNRRDLFDPKCSALEVEGREFKPIIGGDYHVTVRFESQDPNEKIYGMGQYQQPFLNIKGADLELAHRNSQASVPFALSSLGYGILWNNPSIGRAVFGKNNTTLEALSTKAMDYWVTVGDTPAEIEEMYAEVTGKVPMMPEYGLGFWQCKLRYQTQEELLQVAREYKRRNLPIDVIVIDYFHWEKQGEWKFDPTYWQDPEGMVKELKEMGIELMVSVWPTVDKTCSEYDLMLEKGYLVRSERGARVGLEFEGATIPFDVTNKEAREYLWEKINQNYYQLGIKTFWLDVAEPEYSVYDFDNYRYDLGSNLQCGNVYPLEYARTFYEGQEKEGQTNIVNLLRCAWAGSQKYGALVWSGDIASSYHSMKNQLVAGLNMGIAGIPWWTTDIGGFHGGDPQKEEFRELFVRWFQWGTFCPVMRLHGDREPKQPQLGNGGGATCLSGADNEVWRYGEKVYEICKKYLEIREMLRPYTRDLMKEAHEKGTPVMRTMFYEVPEDPICWEIEDQYFYGKEILVAPVLEANCNRRKVYLPKGQWVQYETKKEYDGEQWIEVETPLEMMPVFLRKGSHVLE